MKFKNKLSLKLLFLIVIVSQALRAEETTPEDTVDESQDDVVVDDQVNAEGVVDPNAPKKPVGKDCKQGIVELLQIPGVIGLKKSTADPLDICPHIKHSCCDVVDGDKFKKNYTDVVQPRLTTVLEGQKKIYETMMGIVEQTNMKAKTILGLGSTTENECTYTARRIANYKLAEENLIIKNMIDKYHNTLTDIYRSVYCSVCDATAHEFLETGAVTVSYETCREFGSNSIGFLRYFHINFLPLLNMSIAFESSCSEAGAYDAKKLPKNDLFVLKSDISTLLGEAKDNRNDPKWFEFFMPVCAEMKWGQLTSFFMPNVKEFEAYVEVMKHIRNPVLDQGETKAVEGGEAKPKEGEAPKPKEGEAPKPNGRILTDNVAEVKADTEAKDPAKADEEKEVEIAEVLKPIEQLKVFHKDNSKTAPIDAVAFKVEEKGLDLFEIARSTLIGGDRKLKQGHKRSKHTKRGRRNRGLNISRSRKKRRRLSSVTRTLLTLGTVLLSILMI